jgi:SAM-dependent methyltransferase
VWNQGPAPHRKRFGRRLIFSKYLGQENARRKHNVYIVERSWRYFEGFLKAYGPSKAKKILWDREFSGGKWDFIDDTAKDYIYGHLEKHSKNGSILDLGCGPGNTANELAVTAYTNYVGVDISEAALNKATRRTKENGRANKNTFVHSDFLGFVPSQKFDVILFRESMYHVPQGKIKAVLDQYSAYLKEGGVFIVRMVLRGQDGSSNNRPKAMVNVMETEFDVVEKSVYGKQEVTILALRPRQLQGKG